MIALYLTVCSNIALSRLEGRWVRDIDFPGYKLSKLNLAY